MKMFRSDHTEREFLEGFKRLVNAVEKLVIHPAEPVRQRTYNFDDIRRLYLSGQKIEAIKLFRSLTGAGLKDAKDQVEAIKDLYGN
jgi:ribosomal protein L7/L12